MRSRQHGDINWGCFPVVLGLVLWAALLIAVAVSVWWQS